MRIPRRVNTVLDWWSRNVWRPYLSDPGLLVASFTATGSLIALPFLSGLASDLILATAWLLLGWVLQTSRVNALQHKLDAADVTIGALSEQKRRLERGLVEQNALETAYLPRYGGENT